MKPESRQPSPSSRGQVNAREAEFYNEEWKAVEMRREERPFRIPAVGDLAGKRALVCSCGSGIEPVRMARSGAETYACDLSETAVTNAVRMAEFNGVKVTASVMDICDLKYPDNFFDVLYGSSFLHHIDLDRAAPEMFRVLRPGGVAYFRENWDGNPLLRLMRRRLFGGPGDTSRQRWLFVRRNGSSDEYPLTPDEFEVFKNAFEGSAELVHDRFLFFYLLNFLIFKNKSIGKVLIGVDRAVARLFPSLMKYSFSAVVIGRRK